MTNRATPILTDDGQPVYVRGMAASSISNNEYKLVRCGDCHMEVAWAQSTKTGKWYLCNTAEYTTEGGYARHRALPYSPHYKTCSARTAS